jgi:hypothetical protein
MQRVQGKRKQPLPDWGLLLILVFLSLLLSAVVDAVPTKAGSAFSAHSVPEHGSSVSRSEIQAGAVSSGTAFLPLIARHEPTSNLWQAEYYDNVNLSGQPVRTAPEKRIDYDWEEDGPPGLPDNYYSIRWTGEWDFDVGDYTFFVYSDDGVRLWLDGELLIDAWRPGMAEHDHTVRVAVAGPHSVRVEYFESRGDAAIRVRWRRTDLYPVWHGRYFENPWVEGNPRFDQDDSVIQFDWGEGCPEDLLPGSCNRFSVAWEAQPIFEVGTHRVHLYADEGYRLSIENGPQEDDGWYSGQSAEDDYYDFTVSRIESREITYDFHDQGGPAEARLWIVNLAHPQWQAEYYANRHLTGTPQVTREESAVFHDWGLGKPVHGMPTSSFSVRWSGKRYFHAGFYRFGLFADDGVRLRVDGETLVNAWQVGRGTHHSPVTFLTTGYHDVVVEYFEAEGEAEVRYWWE